MSSHTILLYYKYVSVADPAALLADQRNFCEAHNLKGRIIIAEEGINGTLEGLTEDAQAYITHMQADPRFADMPIKQSDGTGDAFPKLSIKVRRDLVSNQIENWQVDPRTTTGKYLPSEELHRWFEEGREFYMVDMRNDYEYIAGHFAGSIGLPIRNFREIPEQLDLLKDFTHKTVVTVCTGGVRCEKASGLLLKHGFTDVYQLQDGIVTYMEKYPNEYFKGKLYVFDSRILMGFDTDSAKHEVVGRCAGCGEPSERYINCENPECHKHFICCAKCSDGRLLAYCSEACRQPIGAI
jgi:UPF0176 protein